MLARLADVRLYRCRYLNIQWLNYLWSVRHSSARTQATRSLIVTEYVAQRALADLVGFWCRRMAQVTRPELAVLEQ
jgi:hypothetical protein